MLALAGCTGYVKRGSALYQDGRYIEAAEVFEHTEGRLPATEPREQAEYGLYRGLTLMSLGDPQGAEHWLQYAAQCEREHPGALRGPRRALLDRAFHDLSLRRPPPGSPPGTAARHGPPPRHTLAPHHPPPGAARGPAPRHPTPQGPPQQPLAPQN